MQGFEIEGLILFFSLECIMIIIQGPECTSMQYFDCSL